MTAAPASAAARKAPPPAAAARNKPPPTAAARNSALVRTFSRSFEWDTASWRKDAACRDSHPQLFFPAGASGVAEIEAAKAICGSCAVRDECLQFALATNQESGIWGGTSEDERRRLRKRWLARRREAQTTS